MSCCEEKLVPNLREYTLEEAADLGHRWIKLEEQGCYEEAERVRREIPMIPGLANNLKEEVGLEEMIAMGINLSAAVKAYGQQWLEK